MHLKVSLFSVAYNVLQQPFQDIDSLSHHLGVIWTKHLKRGCNYQHSSTNMYPKLQTLILNRLPLRELKEKWGPPLQKRYQLQLVLAAPTGMIMWYLLFKKVTEYVNKLASLKATLVRNYERVTHRRGWSVGKNWKPTHLDKGLLADCHHLLPSFGRYLGAIKADHLVQRDRWFVKLMNQVKLVDLVKCKLLTIWYSNLRIRN